MANEIKLVTYANSEVTPQNDAVLTNLEIASNGVIFGCNVTIKNESTLHINAGMGVVYGREFEIVDSDIPVSLSSSGTLLGQLYVHIDLANTSEPAQLLVDTGNSLTPLVDDPTINITTGSTDYQLATFTVDTSTLANLTETFSIVQNPTSVIGNTDISGIADGTVTGAIAQINTDLSVLPKMKYISAGNVTSNDLKTAKMFIGRYFQSGNQQMSGTLFPGTNNIAADWAGKHVLLQVTWNSANGTIAGSGNFASSVSIGVMQGIFVY